GAWSFGGDDCTEKQFGHRICRTNSHHLFGERAPLKGEKLRVPSATTGDGGGGGAGAGARSTSGGRSGHRRRQIARLSGAGHSLRARATQKGDRLHPHDQSSGTTCS